MAMKSIKPDDHLKEKTTFGGIHWEIKSHIFKALVLPIVAQMALKFGGVN